MKLKVTKVGGDRGITFNENKVYDYPNHIDFLEMFIHHLKVVEEYEESDIDDVMEGIESSKNDSNLCHNWSFITPTHILMDMDVVEGNYILV